MTLLGDIETKITGIDNQLQTLDAEERAALAGITADGQLGEGLRMSIRRHFRSTEEKLHQDRKYTLEKRSELRQERAEFRKQIAACEKYLAEHEADEQRYVEVFRLLDQAYALLDPTTDYAARDQFRFVKGEIRLPGRMSQTRANIRHAERKLGELGEE